MKEDELKAIDFEKDFLEENEQPVLPAVYTEAERPPTAEEIIVRQYKAGVKLKDIVKGNGTSYGRVYEILNRHGIPKRNGGYTSESGMRLLTMSKLERASLVLDYKNGMSTADIMEKYSINKNGCYTILDEAGVPRRHNKSPLNLDIAKIIEAGKTEELPTTPKKKIQVRKESVEFTPEPIELYRDGDTLYVHITHVKNEPINQINVVINLRR